MKILTIIFGTLIVSILTITCSDNSENVYDDYKVHIDGTVQYFLDTLMWAGGEGDPSGFILTEYEWLSGEPDFEYTRIYLAGEIDSSYLSQTLEIGGVLDTLTAGGFETTIREFPLVVAEKINEK